MGESRERNEIHEIDAALRGIRYMTPSGALVLRKIILENNLSNLLELGNYHFRM